MFQINQRICLVDNASQKGFKSDIPAPNIYMKLHGHHDRILKFSRQFPKTFIYLESSSYLHP